MAATEEHEVVLSEERLGVQKTVVPKERVRLETRVAAADDEIRKERSEMDADARLRLFGPGRCR